MLKSAPGTSDEPRDSTALRSGQQGVENATGVTLHMTGTPANSFPKVRMRRMRRDEFSRRLMRETHLSVDSLIYPIFVVEGRKQRQPVPSMPGVERYSVDELVRECESVA